MSALKLKLYHWRDWHEWAHVYHLLFTGDLSFGMGANISQISIHGDKEINLIKVKDT